MTQPNQDKRGVLLANVTEPTYDSLYPDGDRPSGGTIIANPMLFKNFSNMTHGQAALVGQPGAVANSAVDACLGDTPWATGARGAFGIQGTTAVHRTGYASSMICSIAEGSDGDPAGGDTGADYGAFGGIVEIKETATGTPMHVASGEEFWYGFWMYVPSDFSFETNTGILKYIRHDTNFNVGRIENMVVNGGYNGQPEANQVGWALVREGSGNDKLQSETHMISNRKLILGAWNWVEMYMRPYFDRDLSARRMWCNGEFVCERVGNTNKYINNSGVLTTQVIGSGDLLLSQSDDAVENIYFSTYWNGYSPQDQAWYIDRLVGHKNASEVLGVDAYGNKMMGPQ